VPFDTLVIFSTNFHPNDIFDKRGAAADLLQDQDRRSEPGRLSEDLRDDGAQEGDAAERRGADVHLLREKYPLIGYVYANYQPVFLIDQMISVCNFEGIPYQMSPALIDRAWDNLFVKEETIVH
jgi:hypothetical protein